MLLKIKCFSCTSSKQAFQGYTVCHDVIVEWEELKALFKVLSVYL